MKLSIEFTTFVKKQLTIQLQPAYRSIVSGLLAVLLLGVVVLKETHHLLDHHHEVAHCDNNGWETHLHNEEYAPVDCLICFFHLAPAMPGFYQFSVPPPVLAVHKNLFFYQTRQQLQVNWHFQQRGPPALSA